MRRLLFFRHAKSDWSDEGLADFDRPLNARGRGAAPVIAALVAARGLHPDRVISSTALRTRQTFALALDHWDHAFDAVFTRMIYEAMPEQVLAAIRMHGGPATTLMVIGHNPGLEEAGLRLTGATAPEYGVPVPPGAPPSIAPFPTAGLAVFETDVAEWSELDWGTARLVDVVRPRSLGTAA